MAYRIQKDAPIRVELLKTADLLGNDLVGWLHSKLLRHGGLNWWEKHVVAILNEHDQHRIVSGEWSKLEDLDLDGLLRILMANFRFLKARRELHKDDRDVIRAMREARHRCIGHWPVAGLLKEDILLHLNSIRDFCTTIRASKETVSQVDALPGFLEGQPEYDEGTPTEVLAETKVLPSIKSGLRECYEGSNLTDSQENAVNELQQFLDDPNSKCFILKGYAGTGKTFLIGGLVRYLTELRRGPALVAPTGRAAHVLRERHKMPANTIHRYIYSFSKLKEYREIDEHGDVTYKFYFELRNNDIEHDTVFIVDEASMISDMHSESEFVHFGSGRLLSDLLKFINFDSNDYRKKIIFVGDEAQLPPVGMKESPALDSEYLAEKCLLPNKVCLLTDVVRQDEASPILDNATRMRDLLRSGKFPGFEFSADGQAVTELKPTAFVQHFISDFKKGLPIQSVMVTHTNAKARTYNQAIRSHLFHGQADIVAEDQIIVVRNNYQYERTLLNGQMGVVVGVSTELESRTVPLNVGVDEAGKRKIEHIPLRFRDATLRFNDENGDPFDISCKISEDCLMNPHMDLPSEYSKALWVDFRNRNKDLDPKQPEFKEALNSDPYFNAVMLKFGYAITCHKAQGGEWDTVYIDFDGQNKLNVGAIRWSYTALTRASERVIVTNALHDSMLRPKRPVAKSRLQPDEPIFVSEPAPEKHSDPAPSGKDTIESAILGKIRNLVSEEWKIAEFKDLQFQIQALLERPGVKARAIVYYNSKNKVSRVMVNSLEGDQKLTEELAGFLSAMKGKSFRLNTEIEISLHPSHEPFVSMIQGNLNGLEPVVLHSNTEYHLVARFSMGAEEGEVNYYFDKRAKLSRWEAHPGCPQSILEKLKLIHE